MMDKGCMSMGGVDGTSAATIEIRGNTIISNYNNVMLCDGYGKSNNTRWYSNTFVKIGDRSDYSTIRIGVSGDVSTGHEFYDSVFQGGASYASTVFVSGHGETWYKVGWTLTVTTTANASVQIEDSTEAVVSSGTANGSGIYTATLVQYKQEDSAGKTYYTDHHVEVTLGQDFNETDVTMDATKGIELYPV